MPLPTWLRSRGSESEADVLSPHEMRRKRSIKRMINSLGTGDASGRPLIFIDIFGARNLDVRKKNVDAYAAVHLGEDHEHITSIHKDTNPEWHESCVFQVDPASLLQQKEQPSTPTPTSASSMINAGSVFADLSALGSAAAAASSAQNPQQAAAAATAAVKHNSNELVITVYHRQLIKDEAIGFISFKLDELLDESVRHQWYPLLDRKTGAVIDESMCIEVKVQYSASDVGKMNALAEVLPLNFFDPLRKFLESLEPSQFCMLFDHSQAIPTSKEIRAILQIILATNVPQRDVFRYLCSREVAATHQEATLFRSNSLATKLVTGFCFYHGESYMRKILCDTVTRIVHEDEDLEIDELRIRSQSGDSALGTGGGGSIKNNIKKLGDFTKTILENVLIVDSSAQGGLLLPREISDLLTILCRQVAAKFNSAEAVRIAVAGVLFLRFLCPALTSPQLYGLVTAQVGKNATRSLLLITKIVQCCANNVEFGVKEPYMSPFNKLVKNCQKRMTKFFEQCSGLAFDAHGAVIVEEAAPAEPGASTAAVSTADTTPAPVPSATATATDATATVVVAKEPIEEFDEVELLWSFHTLHQYLYKNLGTSEKAAAALASVMSGDAGGSKAEFQIAMVQEDKAKVPTTTRKLKVLLDSIGPPTDAAKQKRDNMQQEKDKPLRQRPSDFELRSRAVPTTPRDLLMHGRSKSQASLPTRRRAGSSGAATLPNL